MKKQKQSTETEHHGRQVGKNFFWALYILLIAALGMRLFFEQQFESFANLLATQNIQSHQSETLTIGYASSPQSLDPTLFDPVTRSRLVDVYEGLVRTDRNLKIEPALAVSWGLLDPTTWEFKIRRNVTFHNGKKLEIADIVASIDQARTNQSSQLKNLLNTIREVTIVDDSTLHIKTTQPDPLLLNKLAITYIFPKETKDFQHPIGTGPYQYESNKNNQIVLSRFEEYWGTQPDYDKVILTTIPAKEERLNALENGDIDFLADVPPADAATLQNENITVKSIPSLEVNFLMFNLKDNLFQKKEIREAISKAIDREKFVDISAGFAHPVSQFVSNGVFGFNPNLTIPTYDLDQAKKEMNQATANIFQRLNVTFDYPKGLEPAAQYIQNQLNSIGMEIKLNPLNPDQLEQKITKGESQLYYLGWKSELGDASDFLNAAVHSPSAQNFYGEFNGTHYTNADIDHLIEKTAQDLNNKTRLQDLQKIMKTVVEGDVIGIPLFETETIFAFNKKIHFEPRVDGYIYPSEIQ